MSCGESHVAEREDGERSVFLWFLIFKASKIPKGKVFSDDKKNNSKYHDQEMKMLMIHSLYKKKTFFFPNMGVCMCVCENVCSKK